MPTRLGRLLPLLAVLAPGCARSPDDPLTVVTNWPEAACLGLERELGPIHPRWIRVAPDEDPTRALDRRASIDVVLGGPWSSYERLRVAGRLRPIAGRAWLVLPGGRPGPVADLVAAGDRPAEWAAAYARLVREALPAAAPGVRSEGQGAALVASGRAERARPLLRALEGRAGSPPSSAVLFLRDLLDATLGEAREEWRMARAALAHAGDPTRSLALFTEAPPWPPASVARMRVRADGEALIATLAEQVAPEASARRWLLESWAGPARPIDGTLLAALARADEGRLAAEPRFRAWLRSEWTAWARQRYRRVVARLDDPRYGPP